MNPAQRGVCGEELAATYYEQQGFAVLARNYRTRFGEIDLIVQKDALYVFAEVKARGPRSIAQPKEWVDAKKQTRIARAALGYLEENELSDPFMRFDVVEVLFDEGDMATLHCIEGAFTV